MNRTRVDMREQYLTDGYCVASKVVPEAYLDRFIADMAIVVRRHLRHLNLHPSPGGSLDALHEDLTTLHHHDQTRYLATLRVFNKFKSLYDVFLSDRLAGICHDLGVEIPLLHTLPIFSLMSERLKLDRGYHGHEAHQDWHGLQTSVNAIVVWVPFHDVDSKRYPIEVLRGSHLRGLDIRLADASTAIDLRQEAFVPVELEKGDAIFMSIFMLHRTGMTGGDRLRIAASWRYEDAAEPTFIDRGFPFAESRVVSPTLFVPGFPDAEQVRKTLSQPPGASRTPRRI